MSLRGAKRRGNPFPLAALPARRNGLPRLLRRLAMTVENDGLRRPFFLPLSLRGAKRRGNPSPKCCKFLSTFVKSACAGENGLPRQCVHWLAMTAFFEHLQFICCCLFEPIVRKAKACRTVVRHAEIADQRSAGRPRRVFPPAGGKIKSESSKSKDMRLGF